MILMTTRTIAGFTLLIAVLAGTMLLSVGTFIANVAVKQIIIASAVRDSTTSFYAADTGLECALYWDQVQNIFSTAAPASFDITCGGGNQTVTATYEPGPPPRYVRTFSMNLDGSTRCAVVTVYKYPLYAGVNPYTLIDSRGYNTGCGISSPRKTERGLRIRYTDFSI